MVILHSFKISISSIPVAENEIAEFSSKNVKYYKSQTLDITLAFQHLKTGTPVAPGHSTPKITLLL